jgi:lipopolysaccharide biosynthesis protein
LCWANEPWTRAWDGGEKQILMAQEYNEQYDREHARWLCIAMRDPRYIHVDGKPLLIIYRANHLPNPQRTADTWRDEARRQGVGEIALARVESPFRGEHGDPRSIGFDYSVGFQPDRLLMFNSVWTKLAEVRARLRSVVQQGRNNRIRVHDYQRLVQNALNRPLPNYPYFPCVTPMWDNSSRRKSGALVLRGSTPERYEKWLSGEIGRVRGRPAEERIVFINAWNEWAEGNHLEPDSRHGRGYLEATRQALQAIDK